MCCCCCCSVLEGPCWPGPRRCGCWMCTGGCSVCLLLELKRVTGSQHCCWGIGCHHQLHLHVYASQVPIRHQEETYENQVCWKHLFIFLIKISIKLGIQITSTGHWGSSRISPWTPPLFYTHYITSTRHSGTWLFSFRLCVFLVQVPLDRARPPPEPYIDISCGGWDMSDSPEKHISLWAVSQQGKLWFRTGIRQQNPEGTRWEPIQVPREVAQVSAGPKDLLWVVLWDGQLLARTGISKDCPEGSSWELVQPPNQKGAVHVAVGISVVWAVTKDNKVRRYLFYKCSVQVGSDDRTVYFRHGVTDTEVTGRSWVAVSAQLDGSQSTNHSSVFAGEVTAPSQGSILDCDDNDIPKPHIPKITSDSFISALVSERSAPTHDPPSVPEGTQVTSHESDSSILSPSSPSDGSETPWSNVDLKEMKGSVATYTVVQEELPPWAWVTAGGFDIDSSSHVDWFNISDPGPLSPSITPALMCVCVCVSQSVRVTRGCMCWWRDWPPHQWEDVSVTLEQVTGAGAQTGDILYLYYTHDQEKKYVYAVIKEVTALVPVFRDSLYTVAVYTPERTKQRRPILLATPSQQDFNTWVQYNTSVYNIIRPFKSICIGGGHQVWAIARDGAVFYRGSVSAHNPAGECWYHLPSPPKQTLKQVSVGRTSVYAVDENSNLWYRQGLTPSYPQGSALELISSNVCKVSVGPLDQVWIIPMQPKGLSWDFGIGGGWEHLSVRGNSIEAQRSPMPSRTQSQVNGNVVGC
uniref:Tectonin beta-propeller repeat containing 1b n=1 Tax=Sinocyclocheilus rhinocerous TaxID=307959 RepID=A0A673KRV8_9TELE